MLKKISSVVSLSFLVMFLFAVNVNCAPDWVNYGSDNYGVMLYQTLKIDKQGGNHIVQLLKKRVFSDTGTTKGSSLPLTFTKKYWGEIRGHHTGFSNRRLPYSARRIMFFRARPSLSNIACFAALFSSS